MLVRILGLIALSSVATSVPLDPLFLEGQGFGDGGHGVALSADQLKTLGGLGRLGGLGGFSLAAGGHGIQGGSQLLRGIGLKAVRGQGAIAQVAQAVDFSGIEGLGKLAHGIGGCPAGLERTIYGKCVKPEVSQDLFVYKAPDHNVVHQKAYYDHKPKVHYNLVFIRSPSYHDDPLKPLVVPPPKQQTLVYLLSKKPHGYKQNIIEVPHETTKPEVFFVNYKDGDNPILPGGIDLRTALEQSAGLDGVHPHATGNLGGAIAGNLGGAISGVHPGVVALPHEPLGKGVADIGGLSGSLLANSGAVHGGHGDGVRDGGLIVQQGVQDVIGGALHGVEDSLEGVGHGAIGLGIGAPATAYSAPPKRVVINGPKGY